MFLIINNFIHEQNYIYNLVVNLRAKNSILPDCYTGEYGFSVMSKFFTFLKNFAAPIWN